MSEGRYDETRTPSLYLLFQKTVYNEEEDTGSGASSRALKSSLPSYQRSVLGVCSPGPLFPRVWDGLGDPQSPFQFQNYEILNTQGEEPSLLYGSFSLLVVFVLFLLKVLMISEMAKKPLAWRVAVGAR